MEDTNKSGCCSNFPKPLVSETLGTALPSESVDGMFCGQIVVDPTTCWIDYACPHDVFHCAPVPIAQRLARYQEVDSEEEEMVPKLGPSSHRGSTGSHQSIRATLKNQSMKCHRRSGSRAEAKRVSMLSKHTAFSSPMVSAGGVGLSC